MNTYFYLIFFIIIFGVLVNCCSNSKANSKLRIVYCVTSFLFIYLLIVLKSTSVGSDTRSYNDIYLSIAGDKKLVDSSYEYMEKGYVLMMTICANIGLTFRQFLFLCYAIALIPICILFIKYSKNVFLSLLIFVCYQFFVFEMSAIRQSVALGICILAYLILKTNKKISIPLFFLLVVCALFVHKSSIIFMAVPFLKKIPVNSLTIALYLIANFMLIIFNEQIYSFIATYISSYYGKNATIELGGNFYFLVLMVLFAFITYLINPSCKINENDSFKFVCFSIPLFFVISGSNLLRAAMYFTIFLTVLLPEILNEYNFNSKFILNIGISLGCILIFVFTTLIPNQLNIVPYIPFWKEQSKNLMAVLLNV